MPVVNADPLNDRAEYRALAGPAPTLSVQRSFDDSEASYQSMSMAMPIPGAMHRDVSRDLSFTGEAVDTSLPMARSLDIMDGHRAMRSADPKHVAGPTMAAFAAPDAAPDAALAGAGVDGGAGCGRLQAHDSRISRTDSEISMSFSMDQSADVYNNLNTSKASSGAASTKFAKGMFATPDEAAEDAAMSLFAAGMGGGHLTGAAPLLHNLRVNSSPLGPRGLKAPVPSRPLTLDLGMADQFMAEDEMFGALGLDGTGRAADAIDGGLASWGLPLQQQQQRGAAPSTTSTTTNTASSYSTPFVESAGEVEVITAAGGLQGEDVELQAADLSRVLRELAADSSSPSPVGFRVTSESFGTATGSGAGRQVRVPSYEATIDGVWELDHVRVKVALTPSPRNSDAAASSSSSSSSAAEAAAETDVSSQRIFGAAGAFEAFNDRFAEALQQRVRLTKGLNRASGTRSAPPTSAFSGSSSSSSGSSSDIAAFARIAATATPRDDEFDAAAMANEPAAEAAARSLCKLLYKPVNARAAAGDEGLSACIFGLLQSGSPAVVELAIVASSLVLAQASDEKKAAAAEEKKDGGGAATSVRDAVRAALDAEPVRYAVERAAASAEEEADGKMMKKKGGIAPSPSSVMTMATPTPTGLFEQLSSELNEASAVLGPLPGKKQAGVGAAVDDLLQQEIASCARQLLEVVA